MKAQDSSGGILQFYSKKPFAFALSHIVNLQDSFQRALFRAAANDCTPQESVQKCLPRDVLQKLTVLFLESLVFVIIKATDIFLRGDVYVTQGRIISIIQTN